MAYDLHIERVEAIPLADWQTAVSATDGVRLFSAQAHTIINPKTGEVVSIPKRDGDAEVLFPADKKWYPVFRWSDGSAAFTLASSRATSLIRFGQPQFRWQDSCQR